MCSLSLSVALTFPRLQENRVGHDIFNLHCQNVNPEQSRYISLSGKRRFFWSNVPTTVRLLHAHRANAALAHSRCLIVVVVPLHCKTFLSNPTYGAVWLRRGLLAFTACLPSPLCLPSFLLRLPPPPLPPPPPPPPRPSSAQRTSESRRDQFTTSAATHTFTHKCIHTYMHAIS